ncbi:UNVERIFIED_CONTAM: hypothetical protein Slati_0477800 [Sesamum latifolium]|uniref:Integrase catalytic domain-containing protein n=1 Tax=Sesamum latifolium TaxID=2727402 RepID=A0AAW2XZX2_9LAMI
MELEMEIIDMEVYGDSKLIINQLLNIYEVKKDNLVPFSGRRHTYSKVSRIETTNIPVCNRWVLPSLDTSDHEDSNAITIATNNEEDWRTPLIEYLKYKKLADDTRHKTEVRRRSSRFILYKDILYRRSFEGTYQRCLSSEEILEAMTISWSMRRNVSLANYTPTPYTNHQNLYILRWPHDLPLKEVKKETVVDFIRVNINLRYGIPRYIITDNGRSFYNKSMDRLCA